MDAGFHDAGQRHPWLAGASRAQPSPVGLAPAPAPQRQATERLNREIARELHALGACGARHQRRTGDTTTHWLTRLERRRELTTAANALAEAAAYGVLDHPLRGTELLCEIAAGLGAQYLAVLVPPNSLV